MKRLNNKMRLIIGAVTLMTALGCFFAESGRATVKPGARFHDGNLTLEASEASLAELLETIARTAGIDILAGQGFNPASSKASWKFEGEPLEDVLRSVLRGLNYSAVYIKEGDAFRIATLKIYPDGKQGGAFTPLFSGARTAVALPEKTRSGRTVTVMVNSSGNFVRLGEPTARRGAIGPAVTQIPPNETPEASLREPWFAMQLQTEQEEAERFGDLLMLRKQAQAATDPQSKEALAMVYASEAARFDAFKKANYNKIESLKRIGLFKQINGK